MLKYSFGLESEANAVNQAIKTVLNSGKVTADLRPNGPPASTTDVGQAVCEAL
jgi:3-isopropylmalate dehydrogenase